MTDVEPVPIPPADRTLGQKPSIWVSINQLISKHKPLNLGQGFPDFFPKDHIIESLAKTAEDSCDPTIHQTTRSQGHPRLVQALSKLYTGLTRHEACISGPCPPELLQGTFAGPERVIDPYSEIIISAGAYGSLCSAFQAVVNPGDEVIIMEPAFDCYTPMTLSVGGTPVYVALRPPDSASKCSAGDWSLDFSELEAKITNKTKVVVLNTPNNPLGKVFSIEELQKLAHLCIKHNLIVFSDEVYEWVVFPPAKHIKIASLPGMWERTLTIGSAGKTFSVTGWKTGWTIGPEVLISAMAKMQALSTEACPTPVQEALATSFEIEMPLLNTPQSYFHELTQAMIRKTKVLADGLASVGMQPVIPQGGYFLMSNIENMPLPADVDASGDGKSRDVVFNEWMLANKHLSAIPPSVFYCAENRSIGARFLRFCIIKDDQTLEKAVDILKNW